MRGLYLYSEDFTHHPPTATALRATHCTPGHTTVTDQSIIVIPGESIQLTRSPASPGRSHEARHRTNPELVSEIDETLLVLRFPAPSHPPKHPDTPATPQPVPQVCCTAWAWQPGSRKEPSYAPCGGCVCLAAGPADGSHLSFCRIVIPTPPSPVPRTLSLLCLCVCWTTAHITSESDADPTPPGDLTVMV